MPSSKGFIAKFDPKQQRLIRRLRRAMRRRVTAANELAYDSYNFLVIAYCPSEKVSESYFSLGANAHGVSLFFGYNGSKLDDPEKLLQGRGQLNRFVRLRSSKDLATPGVQALILQAIELSPVASKAQARGVLLIRGVSAKQRPRRLTASVAKLSSA
ncbi:MAG TPA: hypothetical protein VG937_30630 [Polyangiaceae bacterium]|jgi:hypothetical protein|nr:hypothetical protein [Polyangiaceae bacterium]